MERNDDKKTSTGLIFTKEEQSQRPQNLIYNGFIEILNVVDKKDELIVQWNHPDITNGPIRHFSINLLRGAGNITTEILTIHNEEYKWTYTYIVTGARPATDYNISVLGVNALKGSAAVIENISTPPKVPQLSDIPKVIIDIKDRKATIDIPKLQLATRMEEQISNFEERQFNKNTLIIIN